jgi:heme/copper-type cytochrome/quinol oxidase subunit 2
MRHFITAIGCDVIIPQNIKGSVMDRIAHIFLGLIVLGCALAILWFAIKMIGLMWKYHRETGENIELDSSLAASRHYSLQTEIVGMMIFCITLIFLAIVLLYFDKTTQQSLRILIGLVPPPP